MKNKYIPSKPAEKYNEWCEKKGLPSSDVKDDMVAERKARQMGLSDREKAAFVSHEHMKTEGFEFDVFTSIHGDKPIEFDNGILLVPCFLADEQMDGVSLKESDMHERIAMQKIARYKYDGWIPIQNWDKDGIKKAIRCINEALSGFGLIGEAYFEWRPRYHTKEDSTWGTPIDDKAAEKLKEIPRIINRYPQKDQIALYSSFGWFNQAYRISKPSAKFLFFMISLESMCHYIEDKASSNSLLFQLKTENRSISDQNKEKKSCIEKILSSKSYTENPIEVIRSAYFDCVITITRKLKKHLENIFNDKEKINPIFKKDGSDPSLYTLRSKIAHGSIDALSEAEKDLIEKKIYDVESIAQSYLISIINRTAPS